MRTRTSILLATVVVLGASCGRPTPKVKVVTGADEIAAKEKEIFALEKMLREDIAEQRGLGASDEAITKMKAKYQVDIDRLKAEIEELKAPAPVTPETPPQPKSG